MANYGIGIGSFMDGFTKGAAFSRTIKRDDERDQWDREDHETAKADRVRRIQREDQRDQWASQDRDIEAQDRQRRTKREDTTDAHTEEQRKWARDDRAADAPIKDAERRTKIDQYKDQEEIRGAGQEAATGYRADRARSIIRNDDGNYTVDGKKAASADEANRIFEQNHGTLMDRIYTDLIPRQQQAYIQQGDFAKAQALDRWVKDERVRKGIETAGRIEGAFQAGDWDGVNKHFNTLMNNPAYADTSGYDVKTEPIIKDGRTTGIKATIVNKATGDETVTNYTDLGQLHSALMGQINPVSVFETNTERLKTASQAQAKIAENKNKTADAIELEKAKRDMGLGSGKTPAEKFQSRLQAQMKVMADNDMNFNKLSAADQVKQATAILEEQDRAIDARMNPTPAGTPGQALYTRPSR